jgi:hypothetical protein
MPYIYDAINKTMVWPKHILMDSIAQDNTNGYGIQYFTNFDAALLKDTNFYGYIDITIVISALWGYK